MRAGMVIEAEGRRVISGRGSRVLDVRGSECGRNIGSTLRAANAAAATSTTALAAAGADEGIGGGGGAVCQVRSGISSGRARRRNATSAQFVQTLNSASGSYAAAEAYHRVTVADRAARSAGRGQCTNRNVVGASANRRRSTRVKRRTKTSIPSDR